MTLEDVIKEYRYLFEEEKKYKQILSVTQQVIDTTDEYEGRLNTLLQKAKNEKDRKELKRIKSEIKKNNKLRSKEVKKLNEFQRGLKKHNIRLENFMQLLDKVDITIEKIEEISEYMGELE